MQSADRFPYFITGTVIACVVCAVAGSLLSRSMTSGMIYGACYLAVCLIGGPLAIARVDRGRITSREAFLFPFFPIFLSPLLVGSLAAAYDWKVDQPMVRYFGIGACFAVAVVAVLGFFRLCGSARSERQETK